MLSLLFVPASFALSIGDLATVNTEKIEGAVGNEFGMPDYEQMLEEDEMAMQAEEAFQEALEKVSVPANTFDEITNTVDERETALGDEAAVDPQMEFSSSAPLVQSGAGTVIGFTLALLISSFFAFNRVKI